MAFPLGAMMALGGGALSAFGGQDQLFGLTSDYRKARRYATSFINKQRDLANLSFARSGALIRDRGEANIQGYKRARRELDTAGESARQSIYDNQAQTSAAVTQDLAKKGLGSTTVGAAAMRGVASDTARSISGLESELASLYADLDIGEGQAEANMLGELSNLELSKQATLHNILGTEMGVWSGIGGGPSVTSLGGSTAPMDFSGLMDIGDDIWSWLSGA